MSLENSTNSLERNVENIIETTSSLREVTYEYIDLSEDEYISFGGEQYFNKTIFIDYLCPNKNNKLIDELKKQGSHQDFFKSLKVLTENRLNEDIGILNDYLEVCEDDEKPQIEMQITALEFTKNALDFELELSGFDHGLTDDQIKEKIKYQEDLDEKLFGEHVSKNPDFILEGYAYTKYLLDKNGDKISSSQKAVLEESLKDMLSQVSFLTGKEEGSIKIPDYVLPEKDPDFEELSQIRIRRDDYMEIFDIFFEIADVPQRSKLTNHGAFYDGDGYYGVPKNSAYKEKTAEEIIRIGPHETSHYINLRSTTENNKKKQPGDIVKEEGVSMVTEALVSGVNIDNMSYMTFSGPSVIMNRLYDGGQYDTYQDAYLELLEKSNVTTKGNIKEKTLRKIRGFHKRFAGGTNKDAAYSLGMKGVLEYVRSDESDIKNLFGGKISLEQMKSGEFEPQNFSNLHVHHILLAELIFYYLKKKKNLKSVEKGLTENGFHENFLIHLKSKYHNFSNAFSLFNQAEKFTMTNKKKVAKILNIIGKSKNRSIEEDREREREEDRNRLVHPFYD